MDPKTIALDSRPTVVELNEFNRGSNDGLRGESATTDTGKRSWAGADGPADFFGCLTGRSEAFGQYGFCRNPK